MTQLTSTALLLTLVTGGCAATHAATMNTKTGVVAYRPFQLSTDLRQASVLEAARLLAHELGATHVRLDGCRLTAIIPVDKDVRDQLVVEVKGGLLSLAYQTQVASARGWASSGQVCASYAYVREGSLANRILAAVAIPNATVRRD